MTEYFIWDRKLCFSCFATFSRGLVLPDSDQSLIPRICLRAVSMDTVKIFFNDIETLCIVVKGSSLSEN